MGNFVEEKNHLNGMVKLLIDLYYQIKGQERLTDAAITTIEDFVAGVTGLGFKYDEKGGQSDDHYRISTRKDSTANARELISSPHRGDDTGVLTIGGDGIDRQMRERLGATDAESAAFADFVHGIEGMRITERKIGDTPDGNHENIAAESADGNTKQQLPHSDHDTDTGALVGRYKISATMAQFKSFAQAMALLENSKGPVHFKLSGIQDIVDTSLLHVEPDLWADEDGTGGNGDNGGKAPEVHWAGMDDINKKINAAINNQEPQKLNYQKVKVIAKPYRVYIVVPESKFALALLKAEPREVPPNQIVSISWMSAKLEEKTGNEIPRINERGSEESIDQSAFMELIKKNLKTNHPDQISNNERSEGPKEGEPDITPMIEAMKAELRKQPLGQIPQRIIIKSNRQEDEQSPLPLKSILVEPLEESTIQTSQKSHQSWISFMQIARAVLINFHIALGSFERIKNCQECGKLFFEKKKGSGLYCSLICKKRYSDKQFGIDRQRCLEKQNIWIRRANNNLAINPDEIKPYTVYKYHCEYCQVHPKPKGGNCPKLIEFNQVLFKRLAAIKVTKKKQTVNRR